MTLKLHQKKLSYPDEGWFFTGRFKVGSVPGMSVASKKIIKIYNEYDAKPYLNYWLYLRPYSPGILKFSIMHEYHPFTFYGSPQLFVYISCRFA